MKAGRGEAGGGERRVCMSECLIGILWLEHERASWSPLMFNWSSVYRELRPRCVCEACVMCVYVLWCSCQVCRPYFSFLILIPLFLSWAAAPRGNIKPFELNWIILQLCHKSTASNLLLPFLVRNKVLPLSCLFIPQGVKNWYFSAFLCVRLALHIAKNQFLARLSHLCSEHDLPPPTSSTPPRSDWWPRG